MRFADVPDTWMEDIFVYFDVTSLTLFRRVCKKWNYNLLSPRVLRTLLFPVSGLTSRACTDDPFKFPFVGRSRPYAKPPKRINGDTAGRQLTAVLAKVGVYVQTAILYGVGTLDRDHSEKTHHDLVSYGLSDVSMVMRSILADMDTPNLTTVHFANLYVNDPLIYMLPIPKTVQQLTFQACTIRAGLLSVWRIYCCAACRAFVAHAAMVMDIPNLFVLSLPGPRQVVEHLMYLGATEEPGPVLPAFTAGVAQPLTPFEIGKFMEYRYYWDGSPTAVEFPGRCAEQILKLLCERWGQPWMHGAVILLSQTNLLPSLNDCVNLSESDWFRHLNLRMPIILRIWMIYLTLCDRHNGLS